MRIMERDIIIQKEIGMFGCMTREQISYSFDMHAKVCQRRLRALVKADYLNTVLIPTLKAGRCPFLFYLGQQAEKLLEIKACRPRISWKTSHQLKNTNILLRIQKTCGKENIACQLMPEHLIRQQMQDLIPDGAVMLSKKNGTTSKSALFYLENDSGHEVIKSPSLYDDIENKFLRYLNAFENNDTEIYTKHFMQSFTRFRTLFIVNNRQRQYAISKLIKDPKYHFVYLTTLDQLTRQGMLSNIWEIPALNKNKQHLLNKRNAQ